MAYPIKTVSGLSTLFNNYVGMATILSARHCTDFIEFVAGHCRFTSGIPSDKSISLLAMQATSPHKWKKQGINHKFLIGNRFHVTLRIVSLISVTMLCLWLPLLCLSVAFTIFQNFGHFWSRSALAMKRQIWPFHEIWLVSAIFSVCHCWMKSSFGRNFFVFLYCLDGFHDT